MLSKDAIQIEAKPRGLTPLEFAIREVSKEHDEDSGWRFQAVLKNDSSATLTDLEFALRYYDAESRFLGLDEGFLLGSDELARQEDKSISINLDIPPAATNAVFSLKARKTSFLEKHSLVIFGVALAIGGILYFLKDIIKN